jgi:AcrR family transcriptional regulator
MDRETPQPVGRETGLVDAALACIGRVGLAKTTLDDVAREAGCARATVYRYFPSKAELLKAVVAREAGRLEHDVLAAAQAADSLAEAATAAITTAATLLQSHRALTFVAAYEPELLLPHLAFEREDFVLRSAASLVAPAFERFLPATRAERLGEWIARITLSYLCCPSDDFDLGNAEHVRGLVDDFVLPGFVRPVNAEGVSR